MPSEDPRNNCGANFGSSCRTAVTNCLLRTECKLREVRRLKSENQNRNGSASCLFIITIRQWEPNLWERGGEKRLGLVEKAVKDQSGAKAGRAPAKESDYQKTSFISLIWTHKYLRLATICSVSSADEVA